MWLIAFISFLGALLFGILTWVARNIWRDKTKTQLFALITITFTLVFMVVAWELV